MLHRARKNQVTAARHPAGSFLNLLQVSFCIAIIPGGYALQLFQKRRPLAFRVGVCLTSAGQIHKILFLSILRYFWFRSRGIYMLNHPPGRCYKKEGAPKRSPSLLDYSSCATDSSSEINFSTSSRSKSNRVPLTMALYSVSIIA